LDTVFGLTRVPQSASVISSTRQIEVPRINLDQRFFDRALPSPIAPNNRRLKGLAPQLANFQAHFTGLGLQRPFITAGILPGLAALLAPGAA
jgi:hypothetical protein